MFFLFLLGGKIFAREEENWQPVWQRLVQNGWLTPAENRSRLELAEELFSLLDKIVSRQKIGEEDSRQDISFLIEEFRDELFLLEQVRRQKNQESILSTLQKKLSFTGGRIGLRTYQYWNSVDYDQYPQIYQDIHLEIRPGGNFFFNLGWRSSAQALDYSSGVRLRIDEASVRTQPFNNFQVTIGRIYFLLDNLGLIADNYFDALEGVELDYALPFFRGSLVYSRLSSTNYPYTNLMTDFDDYLALRLSKNFSRRTELGLTALVSGIGSERALALDFYTRLAQRELASELAFYFPSQTNYFLEDKNVRMALVAGLDLFKSKKFDIFAQAGCIQEGFTPMASSLLYSAGNHLYFDQNTTGLDLTFSYTPGGQKAELWETHLDRTGRVPSFTLYELELVGLYRTKELDPNQYRFILRHNRNLTSNLYLYLENTFFVPVNVLSPNQVSYNQFLLALVYNF